MRQLAVLFLAGLVSLPLHGQGEPSSYRLIKRDLIEVSVFDEPDLKTEQRIDESGAVRLPLLGNFSLQQLGIREAEEQIEKAYIDQQFLRRPQVTIRVVEFAPREVSVLGSVGKPGKIVLPAEEESIDIVDVIARAGDFTRIAKRDAVTIRRKNAKGETEIIQINVADIILGKGSRTGFKILPGDVVFVPETFL